MRLTKRFDSYPEAAAYSFMMGGVVNVDKRGSTFWANW